MGTSGSIWFSPRIGRLDVRAFGKRVLTDILALCDNVLQPVVQRRPALDHRLEFSSSPPPRTTPPISVAFPTAPIPDDAEIPLRPLAV